MPNTISASKWTGSKPYLHFAALWGLALMLMLNWPEGYRAFLYLNLIIVVVHAFSSGRTRVFLGQAAAIAAIPLILTILHMLAVGEVKLIKEIRHLWLAAFTCLSVVILTRGRMGNLRPWLPLSVMLLLAIYCIAQIMGIVVFENPFGTNRNPHYLALYSSLGFPLAIYCLFFAKYRLRYLMVPVVVALGYFVLHTSSRPAWIALVVSSLCILFFVRGKSRMVTAFLILAIPVALFFTNLAGFGDRMSDLASNIRNEERVVIWQDAWRMQEASSLSAWVVGHGLDSYEEDFQSYSRYKQLMNFNSPHNSFLETLYTSGIIGLLICIWLYWWIYSRLWRMAENMSHGKLAMLLMSLVTINLLFIMITIPFVSHYNIYTLALIIGVIFYLKNIRHASNEA